MLSKWGSLPTKAKFALSHENQRYNRHLRRRGQKCTECLWGCSEMKYKFGCCPIAFIWFVSQQEEIFKLMPYQALLSHAAGQHLVERWTSLVQMQWNYGRDVICWTDGPHPESHQLGGSMGVSLPLCGASTNMSISYYILYSLGI